MEYSIGDKVIHPQRGAGTIVGIEHVELVEGYEHYYAIELPEQSLTMHIPMRQMEELGVRPAITKKKLDRVLDTLRAAPDTLSKNYKARQSGIRRKLQSGRPLEIARAVRDLTWRQRQSSLTAGDSKLLRRARDFLVAEIALVTERTADDVREMIDKTLKRSFGEVKKAS